MSPEERKFKCGSPNCDKPEKWLSIEEMSVLPGRGGPVWNSITKEWDYDSKRYCLNCAKNFASGKGSISLKGPPEIKDEKVIMDIEKFVLFHKNRVSLLKEFAKSRSHGRLIFQICFLGFESLARILFLNERFSKVRFISLLSTMNSGITKDEATKLYEDWRCSLIHQGFIPEPWTTLENWGEYDIAFLSYTKDKLRSSTEYSPESMISIYENRIQYLDALFKKKNIKKIEIFP